MLLVCRLFYSTLHLYYESVIAGAGIQQARCEGLAKHSVGSLGISGWERRSVSVWCTGHFKGLRSACCRSVWVELDG